MPAPEPEQFSLPVIDPPEIPGAASVVRLEWFNHQNVLMNAFITQVPEGYQLELEGIFGVSASFVCKKLSVSLEPGIPAGSNYAHDRELGEPARETNGLTECKCSGLWHLRKTTQNRLA